jgi:CheY-like chemotaxis protein
LAYNFKNVRILIVESSPELYELFRSVLKLFGVPERNVESAYSMEEGFEKFTKGNHDLVIIDWLQTPDRGIDLAREIRMSGRSPNPFVPIIMTAGSGHENRVKRARWRRVGISGQAFYRQDAGQKNRTHRRKSAAICRLGKIRRP